jgi:hypothetical protein
LHVLPDLVVLLIVHAIDRHDMAMPQGGQQGALIEKTLRKLRLLCHDLSRDACRSNLAIDRQKTTDS